MRFLDARRAAAGCFRFVHESAEPGAIRPRRAVRQKLTLLVGLPVVVDFYSDSCGPCRMIAPAFKKLAAEFKDRAVFAKVNVAACAGAAPHSLEAVAPSSTPRRGGRAIGRAPRRRSAGAISRARAGA